MRAINSTAVSLGASAGILNGEQKSCFDLHAQGHSSHMARQLYTHMTENDRAKGIQSINDNLHKHFKEVKNNNLNIHFERGQYVNNDDGDDDNDNDAGDSRGVSYGSITHMSPSERIISTNERSITHQQYINPDAKYEIEEMNDWGLDHTDFNAVTSKIKYSDFEKQFISNFIDKNSSGFDKWGQCLRYILRADATVRRQFHVKHIQKAQGLRDAMRVRVVVR